MDEAREATAGVALAILDRVRRYLCNRPLTLRLLRDVIGDSATARLDD